MTYKLPEPDMRGPCGTGDYFNGYTANTLRSEIAAAEKRGAEKREAKLMSVGILPVTPDYFEHEDDDDCWRECPDDCDIIDSAGGSDLIIGNEYECEVAWRGTQRFRVIKLPDDSSDDYEVKLISSSHDFYTAEQLAAARLQGAEGERSKHTWQEDYQHFLSYSGLADTPELKMAYEHGATKGVKA